MVDFPKKNLGVANMHNNGGTEVRVATCYVCGHVSPKVKTRTLQQFF
jgi:hypothetical protein